MRFGPRAWLALLLALPAVLLAAEPEVASLDGSFVDSVRRDREVPYRAYYPAALEGRYPVVIFSHGQGGSREGNAIFGRNLAARGYVCIHIQHAGSDREVIEGVKSRRAAQQALRASQRERLNILQRFEDVPFVVRELARLDQQDAKLQGHLDLTALGMAGHSYGAISTLVAAGEGVGPNSRSFKVAGLRAAVALSPSPPSEEQDPVRAYQGIDIPVFHITGTEDRSPAGLRDRDITPADRLEPFAGIRSSDQYLLVLQGADHETFSGKRISDGRGKSSDREHMEDVVNGAALFFDAYLKGQEDKKNFLRGDFRKQLAKQDRFEFK